MRILQSRDQTPIRVATWNLQGARPKGMAERWGWLQERVEPDVALLTEASLVASPLTVLGKPQGIDARRRWGSYVVLGQGFEGRERAFVKHKNLYGSWEGAVVAADISREGAPLFTVVSMYGMLKDADGNKTGHAYHSVSEMLDRLGPLIKSRRNIIIGGDLNLVPKDATAVFAGTGLIDLTAATAHQRQPNEGCRCHEPKPCGHLWTHKNNSPNSKPIQTDYLFASPAVARRVISVVGGPEVYPEVWDFSDHAPVVAEIAL